MRYVPFVNSLLLVGFVAVVVSTIFMMAYNGYNDKLTHSCFILHATNGFLLMVRHTLRSETAS
jgi:hypothetical protein